jgi:hypothetical protein
VNGQSQSVEWSKLVGEIVSYLEDCCSSVIVSSCCEELVTEADDSLGTQRKGNVPCWKLL